MSSRRTRGRSSGRRSGRSRGRSGLRRLRSSLRSTFLMENSDDDDEVGNGDDGDDRDDDKDLEQKSWGGSSQSKDSNPEDERTTRHKSPIGKFVDRYPDRRAGPILMFATGSAAVVVVLGILLGIRFCRPPPSDGLPTAAPFTTTASHTQQQEQQRVMEITSRIRQFENYRDGDRTRRDGEDENDRDDATNSEDPSRKAALRWITQDDPMQVSSKASNLIQRYIAAYVYYALTQDGPWEYCNPPSTTTTTTTTTTTLGPIPINSNDTNPSTLSNGTMDTLSSSSSSSSSTSSPSTSSLSSLPPSSSSSACFVRNAMEVYVPSTAWLTNTSECAWAGLTCDENGQVRSIEMVTQLVSGEFPTGIVPGWPFLQSVVIMNGYIRGPLPTSLMDMRHLVEVRIANNEFTGTIPREWWPSSSSSKTSSTDGIRRNLQYLDLAYNRLTGTVPLSESIYLSQIKTFALNDNQLRGTLPAELALLSNAVLLDLSSNEFEGTIPEEIYNLQSLQGLILHHNNLSGNISNAVGQLTGLSTLSLDNNPRLGGTIPGALFDIPYLAALSLNDCNLEGTIPRKIGKLGDSINILRLSNNKLRGTVPRSLSRLGSIDSLWLQGNAFTGAVPVSDRLCHTNRDQGPWQFTIDIKADCSPAPSEGNRTASSLRCNCCTECCQPGGSNCYQQ